MKNINIEEEEVELPGTDRKNDEENKNADKEYLKNEINYPALHRHYSFKKRDNADKENIAFGEQPAKTVE
jgi:hypothetical protein